MGEELKFLKSIGFKNFSSSLLPSHEVQLKFNSTGFVKEPISLRTKGVPFLNEICEQIALKITIIL